LPAISLQCRQNARFELAEQYMIPTQFFQVSSDESINFIDLRLPVTVDPKEFEELNAAFSELLINAGADRWVVDLSHVSYMGSSALGLLVNVRQQIHAARGRLVLCGLSPQLLQVFHTCCLERLFTIVKTRENARRELGVKASKHARG
jgi:anti-anti-sigma factor